MHVQVNVDSATSSSLKTAVRDAAGVLLYAGDGDATHIITEDANGLPAQLAPDELTALLGTGASTVSVTSCGALLPERY